MLTAAHSNLLSKRRRCSEQTGSTAKKPQRGFFRAVARTNPTCPTNTSVHHADGRAIKRGSRRSKGKSLPRQVGPFAAVCQSTKLCFDTRDPNVSRLWTRFSQFISGRTSVVLDWKSVPVSDLFWASLSLCSQIKYILAHHLSQVSLGTNKQVCRS